MLRTVERFLGEPGRFARPGDWAWVLASRVVRRLPGEGHPLGVVHLKGARPFLARLGTTDWNVLREVYVEGEYDFVAERGLEGVRTVVDLGANVGITARLWRELYPGARVVAVEPDHAGAVLCRLNAGVEVVEAAVLARPGPAYLRRTGGEWGYRALGAPERGAERVRGVTMPELMDALGIGEVDLLKVDVEGGERELFAECGAWAGRVRNVAVELEAPYGTRQLLEDLARGGHAFACVGLRRKGRRQELALLRRED